MSRAVTVSIAMTLALGQVALDRVARWSWTTPMYDAVLAAEAGGAGDSDERADGAGMVLRPGLCIEVTGSDVDPSAMRKALETIVASEPEFFPDALILFYPEAGSGSPPSPGDRIGVWAEGGSTGASRVERGESLASGTCRRADMAWGASVSRELLQAGAERLLAGARIPSGGDEALIPEDAAAEIAVELHADGRVRTMLEFSVPAGPFRLGGTCWIDEELRLDPGARWPTITLTTGMDVAPFVESGCAKFETFMAGRGAAGRALGFVPTTAVLADRTTVELQVLDASIDELSITLSGTLPKDQHVRT